MIKHNRIYAVLLVFYAFAAFYTAVWVLLLPQGPLDQKIIALAICLFLGVMTVVVLVLRLRKARLARIATRITNIIYLFLPPFGTPIGIYGLLMVDRERSEKGNRGTTITKDS